MVVAKPTHGFWCALHLGGFHLLIFLVLSALLPPSRTFTTLVGFIYTDINVAFSGHCPVNGTCYVFCCLTPVACWWYNSIPKARGVYIRLLMYLLPLHEVYMYYGNSVPYLYYIVYIYLHTYFKYHTVCVGKPMIVCVITSQLRCWSLL
jgi:hypothetical protein